MRALATIVAVLAIAVVMVAGAPNVTINVYTKPDCTGKPTTHHVPTYECDNAISKGTGSETFACPVNQKCVYFSAHSGAHCSGPKMNTARVCNVCSRGRMVQCLPNGQVMFGSNCTRGCSECTYTTTAHMGADVCYDAYPGQDDEGWVRLQKVDDCETVTDSWWNSDRCNGVPDLTASFPSGNCLNGVELTCQTSAQQSERHVYHNSMKDLPREIIEKARNALSHLRLQ